MAVDACRSLAREREEHGDRLSEPLRELLARGAATTARDYGAAVELADRCRGELDGVLAGVDAILTPAARGEAPLGLDSTGDPLFCRAWTLIGTPAVSVPGMTGETACRSACSSSRRPGGRGPGVARRGHVGVRGA